MNNHHSNTKRCFGGPGRANCQNAPAEGSLLCHECRQAMRTYGQGEPRQAEPVYTHCCCGAPIEPGQVLCAPCEAREWPRLFRAEKRGARKKIIAILAALLLALTLACSDLPNNGSCESPTPCGSNFGGNP